MLHEINGEMGRNIGGKGVREGVGVCAIIFFPGWQQEVHVLVSPLDLRSEGGTY